MKPSDPEVIRQNDSFHRMCTSNRFGWMGAVLICCLSVIFCIFALVNMNGMEQAAAAIYQHPFTVNSAAWEARSRVGEMRIRLERLLAYNRSGDIQQVRQAVDKLDGQLTAPLDLIHQNYLGDPEVPAALSSALDDLRAAREGVYLYALEHQNDEISQYLNDHFDPYYTAFNALIDTIIETTTSRTMDYVEQGRSISRHAGVYLIILAILMAAISIYFQRSVNLRNWEIYNREMLFNLLSENISDVFFIYHLGHHKLEYVSSNAQRMLGIQAEEFLKNLYVLQPCIEPEDFEELTGLFSTEIPRTMVRREYLIKNPQAGTKHWMEACIYPVEKNQRVERFVITLSDQTDAKATQQVLKDALINAQNANDSKRDFLSRMSHEIRTPINAIIGMTTIAAASLGNRPRVEDCLKKITFSTRHLLSLINDVLDMSKIDNGKMVLAHEPFDLRQVMESITSIIYPQTAVKGQEYEETLVGVNQEVLVGDALRLHQILINLLSNAVKFTPQGGRIRLEVRQLMKRDSYVRLRFTISDTGIGMDEGFLKRLFNPFEQADPLIAQKYGGTGLGMSITQNLIFLMGGTIKVESEVGKGTSFFVEISFTLPEKVQKHSGGTEAFEDLRVLVADDDRDTCEHVSILLKNMGLDTHWVTSGEQAVRTLLQAHSDGEEYDVCFLDWQMPDMDGVEATRQIRSRIGPDTLIIIISAYDWSVIEEEARRAGADAFISKPMFQSSLYNVLLSVTHTEAPKAEPERAAPFDFSGRRFLLAEDNELNMEIALEFLNQTGAQVETACDGQVALDKFKGSAPGYYDLILMDVQMPRMDGYQATRSIRALPRADAQSVPILAMTANAFMEDVSAALNSGMNEHIAKPIDVTKLYQAIQQYLK